MGKGSSKAPPAPDPMELARAQAAMNRAAAYDTAKLNQINQSSPFGRVTYSGKIGSPDRTQTTTLNPTFQGILDSNTAVQQKLLNSGLNLSKNIPKNRFSFSGLPEVELNKADFSGGIRRNNRDLGLNFSILDTPEISGQIDRAAQGVYDRSYNRLRPELDKQKSQLDTQLVNRGIPIGAQASNSAYGEYNRNLGNVLNDLTLGADQAGRQEHQRLFGNEFSKEGLREQMRQAQFGEDLSLAQFRDAQRSNLFGQGLSLRQQLGQEKQIERQTPFSEIAAVLSGAPMPGMPQFTPFSQGHIAAPDYMGAATGIYGAEANAAAQRAAGKGSSLSGLGSLAGNLFGGGGGGGAGKGMMSFLSDDRVKENIKEIGKVGKNTIYEYNFVDTPNMKEKGFLASEIEEMFPDAIKYKDGLRYVNYNLAVKGAIS